MTGTRLGVLSVAVLAALLVLIAPLSRAQTSKGTVTGTVTDPSGAVVPDAGVTLKQLETNATRETKTNSAGIYRFDAVDLGLYSISVKASGFKEASASDIVIQANRIATLDFQLQLGAGITVVQVEATATEILQTSDPLRGGNFEPRRIVGLPLPALDSLNVILLLPGAQNATTTQFSNGSNNYSVNGQRARANNFMIDGVENNDISVAGPAFQLDNPDAIQEVSVQTSQFSAEYGRAGGAVVNQIVKSGTNSLHGTANWLYRSQVFNATSNTQRLGARPGQKIPPPFVRNTPDFSIGGPVYLPHLYDGKNKTFFFAAGQWDRLFATALSNPVIVPTDAGVTTLRALASACPNVALYLQALGSLRGVSNLSLIDISTPSAAGSCNGTMRTGQNVQVGFLSRSASQPLLENDHVVKIDHIVSKKQTMNFRWLYDKSSQQPFFNNLEGFDRGFDGITLSGAFTDTYLIRSNWTNEFRFNYGRIGFNFPSLAPDSFHANLPAFNIPTPPARQVTGFGVANNIPQFRFANNWQYQDTMSIISGRHTYRFGVDFLRQLARQRPPFNERGTFNYNPSTGATALANFIDDFGGSGGSLTRVFGDPIYHPNLFRQAYFFQDTWKVKTSLTLDLGLRYENYGQPANVFKIPAFTNYDPVNFAQPNKVNRYDKNFGPVVGFAWNPHLSSGILGRVFGDGKTVWRGGYQISYDAFFNNLLSNIAGSSPNTLGGQINSVVSGTATRGLGNFQAQFATITATPAKATDPQNNLFDPNIRNPYTERWSFGFQRELPSGVIMDLAYVGSVGHHLFQSLDVNPIIAPGPPPVRFVSTVGPRTMRASSTNSAYHSLQLNVRRRYSSTAVGSLQFEGSYTWSHYIDNVSEVFATDSTPSSFQSLPQVLGFSPKVDRGSSDNDRRHRGVINYVWDIRGPKTGVVGEILGGWTIGGVAQFTTGVPITVANGADRTGTPFAAFGQPAAARPDIGNPNAPITSRARIVSTGTCPKGLQNPDTGACVSSNDVFWVQGTGLPGPQTAGRNIFNGPGSVQFDLDVIKRFRITERVNFEYRAEIFNLFNRQNFSRYDLLGTSVAGTAPGFFLNFHQIEALGRSMRMGLKLNF